MHNAEKLSQYERLGYRLDGRRSVPGRGNNGTFSLRYHVQTVSGAHPASYPMGNGGSFPGDLGINLCNHFHLMSKLRTRGAILPVPQYVFMV
jgi:hypothetical protein